MMALQPVINYLHRRGVLSREQLSLFAAKGLLSWSDISNPSDDALSKSSSTDAVNFQQRLRQRFTEWGPRLQGLVRIAQRLKGSTHWFEAALVLRHAWPHDVYLAVTKGLEQREPPLDVLWDALSLEDYYDIVADDDPCGPAYRLLLAEGEQADRGRHAWLLKVEEVAAIFNLRLAQHSLLKACASVMRGNPELLASALRRDGPDSAYWAFVLLYTALRRQSGLPIDRSEEEHGPTRPPPTEVEWQRVWASAVLIEPDTAAVFLIERAIALAEAASDWLCPRSWG